MYRKFSIITMSTGVIDKKIAINSMLIKKRGASYNLNIAHKFAWIL